MKAAALAVQIDHPVYDCVYLAEIRLRRSGGGTPRHRRREAESARQRGLPGR